ncbi:unnamed protein product [Musa acuminata var. zebrina]
MQDQKQESRNKQRYQIKNIRHENRADHTPHRRETGESDDDAPQRRRTASGLATAPSSCSLSSVSPRQQQKKATTRVRAAAESDDEVGSESKSCLPNLRSDKRIEKLTAQKIKNVKHVTRADHTPHRLR